jgi:hypothetical protein
MRESARLLCVFVGGTALGVLAAVAYFRREHSRKEKTNQRVRDTPPAWARALAEDPQNALVRLREWEDIKWRKQAGFHGQDLCHNPDGRGVRVLQYYHCAAESTLTGVVHFGVDCESHRGLCHGGSMCSLMDDVLGHLMIAGGRAPWDGCTVSVSVQLKKPVKIGSLLKVVRAH